MKSGIGLLIILAIIVGGFFIGQGIFGTIHPTYTGKEVFYTEAEYLNFKEVCAAENVNIQKLEVLASEPPVLVIFKIVATKDFPYGTHDAGIPIFLIIAGICILVGFPLPMWVVSKCWEE